MDLTRLAGYLREAAEVVDELQETFEAFKRNFEDAQAKPAPVADGPVDGVDIPSMVDYVVQYLRDNGRTNEANIYAAFKDEFVSDESYHDDVVSDYLSAREGTLE